MRTSRKIKLKNKPDSVPDTGYWKFVLLHSPRAQKWRRYYSLQFLKRKHRSLRFTFVRLQAYDINREFFIIQVIIEIMYSYSLNRYIYNYQVIRNYVLYLYITHYDMDTNYKLRVCFRIYHKNVLLPNLNWSNKFNFKSF